MIVLELITREHLYDGLSDSQIIYKLTGGNVEIPKVIDFGWYMLLKGLLMKDSTQRWKYKEVARWITGTLEIPTHYDDSPLPPFNNDLLPNKAFTSLDILSDLNEIASCSDGNKDLITEEIAHTFTADEDTGLEKDIPDSAPEHDEQDLSPFADMNFKSSFSVMGEIIDIDNLRLFMERVKEQKATDTEIHIVEMLADGQLISFYDEYADFSGEDRDPFLYMLLLYMYKKTFTEQWTSLEAIMDPSMFLWPDDLSLDGEEILGMLIKMRTMPLRKDSFEAIEREFVLPAELLSMLSEASTYAEAATLFFQWKAEGLLLPKDFYPDENKYLSLDEYAKTALVHCQGHTRAVLEEISHLIDVLQTLQLARNNRDVENIENVVERLDKLKRITITPVDSLFISKVTDLLTQRKSVAGSWHRLSRYFVAGGLGGLSGLLLWIVRFFTGNASNTFFTTCFLVSIAGILLGAAFLTRLHQYFSASSSGYNYYYYYFDEDNQGWRRGVIKRKRKPIVRLTAFVPIVLLIVALLYFFFTSSERMFSDFPNLFPFLIGVMSGCTLSVWIDVHAFYEIDKLIADACGVYIFQMPQN